jgi:porin
MKHAPATRFFLGVCLMIAFSMSASAQQGIDDDLPFGAPDLLLYSDGQAELNDDIDLTFSGLSGLADCGIAFDADVTQFYYGVASGGREQEFSYGGHGDYVLNLDMDKVAGREGLFVQVRAEHRFGEDVNSSTGALMPSSILMSLPVANDDDLVLSEYFATQFFSNNLGVFAGKTARIEGDPNRFAAGRGREQFSNLAFVANPIPLLAISYSSMSAGVFYTADPMFNQYVRFVILDPTDRTTTSGFSDMFAEGVTLIGEGRLHTHLAGKSGHILMGGVWSSRDFNALGQDPRILFPPLGIRIAEKSDTWALFWNFDQFLVEDRCHPGRGWGVFGRAGISDGNPNPIEWYLSLGLGGTSPISGRENDTFGAGWYYLGLSNELGPIANLLLQPRDETGVEVYYKAAVCDWFEVTADVQVVEPAIRRDATTALMAGLRANIEF